MGRLFVDPRIRGHVPRYSRIQVEFRTLEGERMTLKLSGFIARIFQHEYDHINGAIFLDRVKDKRTLITEKEYRRRVTRN